MDTYDDKVAKEFFLLRNIHILLPFKIQSSRTVTYLFQNSICLITYLATLTFKFMQLIFLHDEFVTFQWLLSLPKQPLEYALTAKKKREEKLAFYVHTYNPFLACNRQR